MDTERGRGDHRRLLDAAAGDAGVGGSGGGMGGDGRGESAVAMVEGPQDLALLRYIDHHVIHHREVDQPRWYIPFNTFMILVGAFAGAAWLRAARKASALIPQIQPFLRGYFKAGTIITVGSDGAWVMNEVAKMASDRGEIEYALAEGQLTDAEGKFRSRGSRFRHYIKQHYGRLIFVGLVSGASVVASVYATIITNHPKNNHHENNHHKKHTDVILLATLTGVVNLFGYGIYGSTRFASRFIGSLRDWKAKRQAGLHEKSYPLDVKSKLIDSIKRGALTDRELLNA